MSAETMAERTVETMAVSKGEMRVAKKAARMDDMKAVETAALTVVLMAAMWE